ncbi:hypothetical protein IWW39_005890 [Coemansia spiralis]|uniref:Uncharacterized protein n=1 Tax=Coemansia spiralis TaxID=417178 RepID=A0A9W8GDP1_9FUNG|nr:hypothetical protein IWW39_005890 [Coemansia spiralis]
MATKLADLDGLVKDAIERKQATSERPVSNMTPDAINRSRSVAIKRVELARLKEKLAQVQGENSKSIKELGSKQAMLAIEHRAIKETMELVSQI